MSKCECKNMVWDKIWEEAEKAGNPAFLVAYGRWQAFDVAERRAMLAGRSSQALAEVRSKRNSAFDVTARVAKDWWASGSACHCEDAR